MKKWAQASLVTAAKPVWISSGSETKSRRIPRPPRPKRSCPGDVDERRSADSPGIARMCRMTNETINNYSLVLSFRRRGEERTRRSTTRNISKRTPTYRTKDPLSASSCCQLMVATVRPCRCHSEIWPPLPGAGLDRFPPPSVSLTTR
jgi:hypothetical protein